MKIRHLQYLVLLNAIAVTGFVTWSAAMWLGDEVPLLDRPLQSWMPSDLPLSPGVALGNDGSLTFAEALDRPLFRKSRRPFHPPVTEQVQPSMPPVETASPPPPPLPDSSQLVLKGLWISAQTSKALIASSEFPEGVWLKPGASIAGWTIVALDQNGATLDYANNHTELKLYVDMQSNSLGGAAPAPVMFSHTERAYR